MILNGEEKQMLTALLEDVTRYIAVEKEVLELSDQKARDRLVEMLLLKGVRLSRVERKWEIPDGYFLHGDSPWVSVDVKLPMVGQFVLAFCEEDGINMAKYVGQKAFTVHLWDFWMKPHKVTHWMPLPASQKEDGHEFN